jgi:hypothetical protein
MLTLLLALAVSQATVDDDAPPPPPRAPLLAQPVESSEPEVSLPPAPPPAVEVRRSARLLPEEPRVSAGTMMGRIGMSLALGLVGELTGELAGLGISALGLISRSTPVFVGAVILGVLVRVGFAAIGVAMGSALFGKNFGADLRATIPVASISVASAILIGTLLALALPYVSSLILVGVPLIVAAVATPLIVQLRKSDAGPAVMRDSLPMSGATVSF